jgi:hypothetical protein
MMGKEELKARKQFFPFQVPLFHHSIIPRAQQKSDVHKKSLIAMHRIRD